MVGMNPEESEYWWHYRNRTGWRINAESGASVKITSWQSDMAGADWVKGKIAERKQAARQNPPKEKIKVNML